MSRRIFEMNYKESQIVKHALQSYLMRDNATDKEIAEEERVLLRIWDFVEQYKGLIPNKL